jgi:hypothetical protein
VFTSSKLPGAGTGQGEGPSPGRTPEAADEQGGAGPEEETERHDPEQTAQQGRGDEAKALAQQAGDPPTPLLGRPAHRQHDEAGRAQAGQTDHDAAAHRVSSGGHAGLRPGGRPEPR